VYFAGVLFESSDTMGFLGIGPDPDRPARVEVEYVSPEGDIQVLTRLAPSMGVVRNSAFTRVVRAVASYRGLVYMGGNFLDPNRENMQHLVAFDGTQVSAAREFIIKD
jgi:hypothetical protein